MSYPGIFYDAPYLSHSDNKLFVVKRQHLLPLTKKVPTIGCTFRTAHCRHFLPSVNPLSGAFHRYASAIQAGLIALGLIAALYLRYLDGKLFVVIARHLRHIPQIHERKYAGVCPFAGIFVERGIYTILSINGLRGTLILARVPKDSIFAHKRALLCVLSELTI